MTKGSDLIAAERERQVTEEGWTAEHDAGHAGQLARAAACYALQNTDGGTRLDMRAGAPALWPWEDEFWKPTRKPTRDPVRDLVKAGALIAAAIDALEAER